MHFICLSSASGEHYSPLSPHRGISFQEPPRIHIIYYAFKRKRDNYNKLKLQVSMILFVMLLIQAGGGLSCLLSNWMKALVILPVSKLITSCKKRAKDCSRIDGRSHHRGHTLTLKISAVDNFKEDSHPVSGLRSNPVSRFGLGGEIKKRWSFLNSCLAERRAIYPVCMLVCVARTQVDLIRWGFISLSSIPYLLSKGPLPLSPPSLHFLH